MATDTKPEARAPIAFTLERGWHVATCKGCGWLLADKAKPKAASAAAAHKCRKKK
ncbi:hypothetical protein ABFU82_22490 [Nocardioides sp. WV_118_6]